MAAIALGMPGAAGSVDVGRRFFPVACTFFLPHSLLCVSRPHMSRASVHRGIKRFATRMARWSDMYLNYFRVHMMYFIVMIMFWSAIMYASNPKDHYIPYICLLYTSPSPRD